MFPSSTEPPLTALRLRELREHVRGSDHGVAEEEGEDAELDPGGEERPVYPDQAPRERDREQENRRGRVRDEVPRLATDLLRIPRQILGGPGHHQDQGAMATDEGAGENGDVHVRRKGAARLEIV